MDDDGHQVWQIKYQGNKFFIFSLISVISVFSIICVFTIISVITLFSVISVISVVISAFSGGLLSQIRENWLGWEGFLGEVSFLYVILYYHI